METLHLKSRPEPVIPELKRIASETNLIYNIAFVNDAVKELKQAGFTSCDQGNTLAFTYLLMVIKAIETIRTKGIEDYLSNTTAGVTIKEIVYKLMKPQYL